MRSDTLLISSCDMPHGDERDIPVPTTFAYWKDVVDKVDDPEDPMTFEGRGLTRWSILAILPYWGELLIRHLLDPMHIEGNVGKALIKAFYGEKDMDTLRKVCADLEIHSHVWVAIDPITKQEHKSSTPWVLSVGQRREFRN